MDAKDTIIEALGRVQQLLNMSLDGLTVEQLAYRPAELSNSIAWLTWHLTRVQDNHMSALADRDQEWIVGGWHAKFNKPADPKDTGHGHSAEQVAGLRASSPQLLLDYHDAVYQRSCEYLKNLHPADLDVVLNEPRFNPPPTVGVRLVSVVSDNLQHAGQVAYLRGLIENKRWFPA